MDHIAHEPGLDGQAFHLVNPRPQRAGDVLNTFARAAHAPQMAMRVDKRMTDMLPKGVALVRDEAAGAARTSGARCSPTSGIPDAVLEHMALVAALRRPRRPARAARAPASRCRRSRRYAGEAVGLLGAQPRPRPVQGPLVRGRRQRQDGRDHRRVERHRPRGGAEDRRAPAGSRCSSRARAEKLEEVRDGDRGAPAARAYAYTADLVATTTRSTRWSSRILADHAAVDVLVNNAGRSIRRSVALSYDRFHDYERTIQLNYLGTVKLILGLLPHMRERGAATSSTSPRSACRRTRRASPPTSPRRRRSTRSRAWSSSETIGDNVTFTTIHMPLVRTPMIAPTKIYDSFPTISPDEAADLICEAIRAKPKQINTRLGTFGEVAYALAPKAVDQILHMAYKVFPESSAARGRAQRSSASRPRARRSRSRTSCAACTGDRLEAGHRIDRGAAHAHLEVQVRAGRAAGRADAADPVARRPRTVPARRRSRDRWAYQEVIPSRWRTTTRLP